MNEKKSVASCHKDTNVNTDIPVKIYNIFNRIKDTTYIGDIDRSHFAVAIKKGKIISPVGYNYYRLKSLGILNGSLHAEMNVINYLVNMYRFNRKKYSRLVLWERHETKKR